MQCSLLEKLPWNAVGMSHEHWPHENFTRFWKITLAIFGQGSQRRKFLFFLAIFDQGYQRWNFLFFEPFQPRIPTVKVFGCFLAFLAKDTNTESFCFFLVIFGQGYQRWKFLFFLAIFDQGYPRWNFLIYEPFRQRILMVKVFFCCHFWSRMPTVKAFVFWAFLAKDTNG